MSRNVELCDRCGEGFHIACSDRVANVLYRTWHSVSVSLTLSQLGSEAKSLD
ncbi:MAG: hypothetical protein PUP91_09095 [Rhizonema sp. PD37]|nr:hypothetical protein [Rhizonema sp. PD37]